MKKQGMKAHATTFRLARRLAGELLSHFGGSLEDSRNAM